jgi:regulatory protein
VLAAAARLLESRSRTTADVRARLVRAGWPARFIEQALERLSEIGLLDDEAYARGWLESRDRGRPRGERVLRQELRLRGVPGDTATAALEERREAADADGGRGSADEAAAAHLLQRRASALARIPDPRVRGQRAYALLARNGFDPDVAGRVAALWAAQDLASGDATEASRPNRPL